MTATSRPAPDSDQVLRSQLVCCTHSMRCNTGCRRNLNSPMLPSMLSRILSVNPSAARIKYWRPMGLCRLNFSPTGEIGYTPLIMKPERLKAFQDHLLLYFTGFSRTASEIAKEQIEKTKQRRVELFAMLQMVQEGMSLLTGDHDLAEFGELLHEAWMVKRGLTSKITTPLIDQIYDAARNAGALGENCSALVGRLHADLCQTGAAR